MLPKINHPTREVEIPSTKEKIRIRPMLVREEKILLTAKEGKADNEIYIAIRDVIRNCVIGEQHSAVLNKLTTFDVEYLFLKVRAASVGNSVELLYTDSDDVVKEATEEGMVSKPAEYKEHKFTVDLDKVTVKYPEKVNDRVEMGTDKFVTLKYPPASTYESAAFSNDETKAEDLFDEFIMGALDKYWEGDKAVSFQDHTPADIKEFLNNLDIKTYSKIKEFVSNLPTLYYEIKYKNTKGEEKTIKLTSLFDFFMF